MSGGHDNGGSMRWLLTYADMITLLLAFFVIMYAVSKVDKKKYESVATSLRGAFGASAVAPGTRGGPVLPIVPRTDTIADEVRAQLGQELQAGQVQLEETPEAIVLRFPDAVLFERGKAELQGEARAILDKLARVVARLPNRVEAEGHTDSLPIRSRQYPSNWELSAARATAVVRYLVEAHAMSPIRLAARGVGEHQPLYPNEPGRGEPRNRRVEVRILKAG